MSALCHFRTNCIAAKWVLFDHLVGTREQRRRHDDADRLRRLEADYQFKPGWLFDWEITRVRAAHDLVNVDAERRQRSARLVP
jgi:hypothetical protein